MTDMKKWCADLELWARNHSGLSDAVIREVYTKIKKSCLLDRLLNGGELAPSQTKCPVHQGLWSGCHVGWPGQTYGNNIPIPESPMLRAWYDQGCRCYLHKCGCTTGWQPDTFCGCGVKP